MNTEYLKTFLALAKNGSFAQTAKDLLVAQSTISNRIRELEDAAGQKFFARNRSRSELTQAGEIFLEYAEKMLSLEERAIAQVNLTCKYSDRLALGTVYAFYDSYMCKALAPFVEDHPEISVNVIFGHSKKIIAECRMENIDIGFAHHPYQHPEYHCQLLKEDDVILITGSENQEYRGGIPASCIQELPIIYSNFLYSTTHDWLFTKCQRFQLELEIASKALPFVKNGRWYTLLDRRQAQPALDAGEIAEIPVLNGKIPPVQYYSIYNKRKEKSAAVQNFLRQLSFCCPFTENLGTAGP
jgi:LysR family transcriptional repressor of citA